jgi:hypothetical protein
MAVFGAWIIYVTMRGSLPTYLSLLFGTVSQSGGTPAATSALGPNVLTSPLGPNVLTSALPQPSDNTALANVFQGPGVIQLGTI